MYWAMKKGVCDMEFIYGRLEGSGWSCTVRSLLLEVAILGSVDLNSICSEIMTRLKQKTGDETWLK